MFKESPVLQVAGAGKCYICPMLFLRYQPVCVRRQEHELERILFQHSCSKGMLTSLLPGYQDKCDNCKSVMQIMSNQLPLF